MKKKGFTLVELLAVIVILAVIGIITIPLIGNIIDTAKRGTLGASANGIIESAELYYSTKMLENPETKTFICSKEGCISGEEKLDYKGEVTEGRIILYADGKVSICIEDGKNAALKLAEQTEVTTEEGSCNYDNEDYSIDAKVSKAEYNEAIEELNSAKTEITEGKKVISEAITNKGVETEETATFSEMATNISEIETGEIEKSKLIESLKYSDLGLTEESTADEIYAIFRALYPAELYLFNNADNTEITGGWGTAGSAAGGSISINASNISYTQWPWNAYWYAYTRNTVKLGGLKTLKFRIQHISRENGDGTAANMPLQIGLTNSPTSATFSKILYSGSPTTGLYTIDISSLEDTYRNSSDYHIMVAGKNGYLYELYFVE